MGTVLKFEKVVHFTLCLLAFVFHSYCERQVFQGSHILPFSFPFFSGKGIMKRLASRSIRFVF